MIAQGSKLLDTVNGPGISVCMHQIHQTRQYMNYIKQLDTRVNKVDGETIDGNREETTWFRDDSYAVVES